MSELDELLRTVTGTRGATLRRKKLRVQVVAGPDAGAQLEFEARLRIGSRPLAELVLRDPKVSGLHCELVAGDELRVRDLGSKNGTFVGKVRILDAVVPMGELLVVGGTRLRVSAIAEGVDVPLHKSDDYFGIVGQSAAMRALTAQIERVASSDATVLVAGETGTGKERVAEALHLGGRRAGGPLVIVDCGALPPNLIESELFGHERGAFTGAAARREGAFERAHGGTLFLDEIGELPIELQPKLLRAIESREVQRVGGGERIAVDTRIVVATNRDLALEVMRGRFREDLYYRLAVIKLFVPPLRERPDDVPLLAVHLLRQMGADPAACLTVESLGVLMRHDWPGNVRELRNTLERAVALMQPLVIVERSAPGGEPARPGDEPAARTVDLRQPLREGKQRLVDEYEQAYVSALLVECNGNISEVARRAGMDRMSIHRLMQRHQLRGPRRS